MTALTRVKNAKLRWTLPVAVAVLLVGGTLTTRSMLASAQSSGLPARSPAELLVDVQEATVGALSGTVVQSADLGIPALPGLGGGGSSDLTSLISGTHTLRVWHDGTDKARIALLGTLGESDIIKNGSDLWTWSSKDNTATHRTLGAGDAAAGPGTLDPTDLPMTPQEAADAFLQTLDESTVVSSDGAPVVAGREAYQLTLAPRDTTGALISSVSIAIDAVEHIPLRVQVFAVDRPSPVFEVAFSAVDFAAPDDAQFAFNPPPGAQVTEQPAEAPGVAADDQGLDPTGPPAEVVGSGWTAVLVGSLASEMSTDLPLEAVSNALPAVSGSWGSGHLFSGTVFSAVIADDGRVAIGAVKPDLLYAALAG